MTTIPSLAKNTVTLFRLFSTTPIKWAKRAQAPIVRGFRTNTAPSSKTSSYISLVELKNVDPSRVASRNTTRTATQLPHVATCPTPIKVQLLEVRQPTSWLHGAWMPGHVSARIAAFEQPVAAPLKTKRQAPMPPSEPVPAPVKTIASIPQQTLARSTSAPGQTVTPPLPPSAQAGASNPLGRSNSYPPTTHHGKALFAEMAEHPLVLSRAPLESMGKASEVEANSSVHESAALPLQGRPLDPFQLALTERMGTREPAAPIEVTAEVKRQAEKLRKERQAKLNAAMRNDPRKQAVPTPPGSEESDADTLKRNLMAELNGVLATRSRKVASG
ncbi:hypothetical protein [Stenotrophomonas sp. PS02289]|uniref:hypothetical protein n=1 Tax=Stenotrophomonas sp. PS02289 TaxID=2991422 RepID=UPI00249C04A4|nr:hypothetical protein [Stenotrophomonas sp. PS02289]